MAPTTDRKTRVGFIVMPMYAIEWPSIQVGLLKAQTERAGYQTQDLYLNIDFAKFVGIELYRDISFSSHFLLGDWLFSGAAFQFDFDPTYLDSIKDKIKLEIKSDRPWEQIREDLIEMRTHKVNLWLNQVFENTDWSQFDVIGFSCTFSQTTASIALATKIKEAHSNIRIIFGGSSLEDSMGRELSRQCNIIDCIVQNEGEIAILEVLNAIDEGSKLPKIYQSKKSVNLKECPQPNYDTYYNLLRQYDELLTLEETGEIGTIIFETSRGCWWGQKHHCTFCGLNGTQINFREKDFDKVLDEIDSLMLKYQRYDFHAVDCILSHKAFKDLLPRLIESETSFRLYCEIKSNLTLNNLKQLKSAGFHSLQPGIESLNTEVLRLMKKGTTASKNLQVLIWAESLNMKVDWNILYGFPTEKSEYYEELNQLLPLIVHLHPPSRAGHIRLDRFSPNHRAFLKQEKTASGNLMFQNVSPLRQYKYCFPSSWDFNEFAFSFESKSAEIADTDLYRQTESLVESWIKRWHNPETKPLLLFKKGLSGGHVFDSRFEEETYEITGQYFEMAQLLEKSPFKKELIQKNLNLSQNEVDQILGDLQECHLICELDQKFHWLPTRKL